MSYDKVKETARLHQRERTVDKLELFACFVLIPTKEKWIYETSKKLT